MFTAAILKAGGASSDDLKVNLFTTMIMRQKGWNEWAKTIMECFQDLVTGNLLALQGDEKIMT